MSRNVSGNGLIPRSRTRRPEWLINGSRGSLDRPLKSGVIRHLFRRRIMPDCAASAPEFYPLAIHTLPAQYPLITRSSSSPLLTWAAKPQGTPPPPAAVTVTGTGTAATAIPCCLTYTQRGSPTVTAAAITTTTTQAPFFHLAVAQSVKKRPGPTLASIIRLCGAALPPPTPAPQIHQPPEPRGSVACERFDGFRPQPPRFEAHHLSVRLTLSPQLVTCRAQTSSYVKSVYTI